MLHAKRLTLNAKGLTLLAFCLLLSAFCFSQQTYPIYSGKGDSAQVQVYLKSPTGTFSMRNMYGRDLAKGRLDSIVAALSHKIDTAYSHLDTLFYGHNGIRDTFYVNASIDSIQTMSDSLFYYINGQKTALSIGPYVKNQQATAQAANFWIAGKGRTGTLEVNGSALFNWPVGNNRILSINPDASQPSAVDITTSGTTAGATTGVNFHPLNTNSGSLAGFNAAFPTGYSFSGGQATGLSVSGILGNTDSSQTITSTFIGVDINLSKRLTRSSFAGQYYGVRNITAAANGTLYGTYIDAQATSGLANAYALYTNHGAIRLGETPHATRSIDSILVSDNGVVKYRSLSELGGGTPAYTSMTALPDSTGAVFTRTNGTSDTLVLSSATPQGGITSETDPVALARTITVNGSTQTISTNPSFTVPTLSIANNVSHYLTTATGTGLNLNGEANLQFDGSHLLLGSGATGTNLLNMQASSTDGTMLTNTGTGSLSYHYLKNNVGTLGGIELGGSTFGTDAGMNRTTFVSQTGVSIISNTSIANGIGGTDNIRLYAGGNKMIPQLVTNPNGHTVFSVNDSSDIINNHNYITQTKGNSYVRDTLFASAVYQNGTQVGSGTTYGDAQARAAISLTTTGTGGAATYNNSTGVFNIPQYTTPDSRTLQTLTYGATTTFDLSTSYEAKVTLTGNTTLTISNLPSDGRVHYLTISIIQDGTGGRTVTWPGSVAWPGGTAPTLTTTANKKDIITFRWNGTTLDGAYKLNY